MVFLEFALWFFLELHCGFLRVCTVVFPRVTLWFFLEFALWFFLELHCGFPRVCTVVFPRVAL